MAHSDPLPIGKLEQFRINENRFVILSDWKNCSFLENPGISRIEMLWDIFDIAMVNKGRDGGPASIRRPCGAVRLGALA